jgi:hypothetical protein
MAIGTLALPAAAAAPRLAFVNGIPGKTVDVCIGNREVKSNLRYGRWFETSVGAGERTVRFRKASPGRCQGRTLARQTFDLEADVDGTVVATTRSPKRTVVFNNRLAPVPEGNVNWVAVRHAADLGRAVITQHVGFVLAPAAAPTPFHKGEEATESYGASTLAMLFAAYRPSQASPFIGPSEILTYPGRRSELILVGTRTSNAKFVTIVRDTIPAT